MILCMIDNPLFFLLLWFDSGLILILLGEYWFTVRKGYNINITLKYAILVFLLSFFGLFVIKRIWSEMFEKYPIFLTHIDYFEEKEMDDEIDINTLETMEIK